MTRSDVQCQWCGTAHAAHLTTCPECQWQATVQDASRVLDKYGFKPAPTPEPVDPDVLWDAFEGRR